MVVNEKINKDELIEKKNFFLLFVDTLRIL